MHAMTVASRRRELDEPRAARAARRASAWEICLASIVACGDGGITDIAPAPVMLESSEPRPSRVGLEVEL